MKSQQVVAPDTIDDLYAGYLFLRQLENRIQMLRDEQTHDWQ